MMGGGSGGAAPAGTGGAPSSGTGGASVPPGTGGVGTTLLLGMGGHPFPQNKKPGSCMLTTVANASGAVQSAYNAWKSTYVTSSGAGSGLRVRRNNNSDDTVSEGIGYGMIAAVYMGDRATFDGLWTYGQSHFDAHGLMNWQISSSGGILQMGSASDGDLDMAWALVMASEQWSSTAYLDAAKKMIVAMRASSIGSDGALKPGDNWGAPDLVNPSYFSPAYFRVFAAVTGDGNWSSAILARNYDILNAVSGTDGLVPDWTTTSYAVNQGLIMSKFDSSTYGYDACRTPWRIAMDYCFNGEPRAKAYLMKIGAFFDGVGAANIADGYGLGGSSKGSGDKNMAFIGTAGAAAMVGFPTLLDGAFTYGSSHAANDYFKDTLRVLTMQMMSGNFLDYTRP
jgi:endo-1,4-beta-D-glucanase Y